MAHTWKIRLKTARDRSGREISGMQVRYRVCGKCGAEKHNELDRGRWVTWYVDRSTGEVTRTAVDCPADAPVSPGQLGLFNIV